MSLTPYLIILLAWLFFGGTHLVLSASKLRDHIVAQCGTRGFTLVYAGITVISLSVLIISTAKFGHLEPAGLNIQESWALNAVSFLGTFLIIAGLLDYPVSPMAALAQRQRQTPKKKLRPLAPPTSMARLTRHPFFVGLALVMAVQTLRAPTLATMIYYGGFVILAVLGIYLQDRKLKSNWPSVYGDYVTQTQTVPIPSSKLWSHASKLDVIKWSTGVTVAAICLTILRPVWSYWNGAMFGVVILVFGVLATTSGLIKSAKRIIPQDNQ